MKKSILFSATVAFLVFSPGLFCGKQKRIIRQNEEGDITLIHALSILARACCECPQSFLSGCLEGRKECQARYPDKKKRK